MKLFLFKLENKNETFVEYNKENFFEGFYDPYTKIINEKAKKELKKLGVDIKTIYKKNKSLKAFLEYLDEEKKEKIEDVLSNLDYLPQAYHCEDIHDKEDIEDLDDNLYFIDNDGFIGIKDDILGWDYKIYYHLFYRCKLIESLKEIEVEKADENEIQKFEEQCYYENSDYMKTYHYNYYKTKDNKLFRVYISNYQGILDSVDEEFGNWDKISKELQ